MKSKLSRSGDRAFPHHHGVLAEATAALRPREWRTERGLAGPAAPSFPGSGGLGGEHSNPEAGPCKAFAPSQLHPEAPFVHRG